MPGPPHRRQKARRRRLRKGDRKPGLYWVRRAPGDWRVARYCVEPSGAGHWMVAGVQQPLADGYFTRVGPKFARPTAEARKRAVR